MSIPSSRSLPASMVRAWAIPSIASLCAFAFAFSGCASGGGGSAPRDLSTDGRAPDLRMTDLLGAGELGPIVDLAAAPDLAAPDLTAAPDLATPDLTAPDLAPPADLTPPPDLTVRPDLALACPEADRTCPQPFKFPDDGNISTIEVRGDFCPNCWAAGVPLIKSGAQWTATVNIPYNKRVTYKFYMTLVAGGDSWRPDPANPNQVDDGYGGKNSVLDPIQCPNFQCPGQPNPTCTDGQRNGAETDVDCGGGTCPACATGKACTRAGDCTSNTCTGGVCVPGTTPWDWRDSVMYFAFVDRFVNGNQGNDSSVGGAPAASNWQGGDWAGVAGKLDYLKGLGVNTLWLNFPVDQTDSTGIGDDGRTYTAYHGYWPRDLGRTERRWGSETELKALVDAAHQKGIKVVFDYAMNHVHRDSPVYQQHPDWFTPLKINGVDCVCGNSQNGVDCSWDGPNTTRCWFRDYLPDFDFNNAAARAFSVGNAVDWLNRTGADGLRLDAVKHIPQQWLLDIRSRLRTDVEARTGQKVWLVGETYTGDRGLIRSFVDPNTKLDGQFDFPLRATLCDAVLRRAGGMGDVKASFEASEATYGSPAIMSTFIGNHDMGRSIHFAQDNPLWSNCWDSGKAQAWSGTPGRVGEQSAYERLAVAMALLMTNRGVPLLYYGDEIGLPGGGDPDNRRFMDWNTGGYSSGQSLLLDRIRKLGAARAAHPALRRGTRQTLQIDNDTWVYKMTDGNDNVWVAINRADGDRGAGNLPQSATDLITGQKLTGPSQTLPPRSARVLVP